MSDERIPPALDRIERALARLDAASARLLESPSDNGDLDRLQDAHRELRGTVETAISRIDTLLDHEEGASWQP